MNTRTTCRHGHPWDDCYRHPDGRRRYCRPCQIAATRAHYRATHPGVRPVGWLQQAILTALRAHPQGLRPVQLRAAIGYRTSLDCVRTTVSEGIRERGWPVVRVRTTWRNVTYRLEEAS